MGWKDFVPDSAEDWVEDRAKDVGDAIEWTGDKVADVADEVGLDDAGDWIRDKSRSAANQLGADVSELELGQTEDPNKLVYGSVSKIRAQVSHLNDFKSSFTLVGNGLKGLEGDGLKGASADAFREAIAKEPPRWFKAAEAFGKAADAMGRFAETVEWAQGQAKQALEDYNKAKKVSQDARTAYNKSITDYKAAVEAEKDTLPPRPSDDFTDPGSPLIKAAQDKLDTARTQRNEVAETARTAVRAARDAAPPKPSYAEQLKDGMDYLDLAQTHLAGGVLKGTAGLGNFVRSVNPMDPYNLTHPAEYLTSLNSTVAGLTVAVNDPMGAGKQMLDEFMKDPSEGIGKLLPELVGTKGLGALKKTASIAKHADDLPGPGRSHLDKDGPDGPSRDSSKDKVCEEDPVDVATGRMILTQTDVALPGTLPLLFERTFESSYRAGRWFGPAWASTIDQRLEIDAEGIVFLREDSSVLAYPHPAPGVPVHPTRGHRWPLSRDADGRGYRITDPRTGLVRHFAVHSEELALLVQIDDRNGNHITFVHDEAGAPQEVVHSGGYHLKLTTAEGRISRLALADGTEILRYGYTDGHLAEVTNSSGRPFGSATTSTAGSSPGPTPTTATSTTPTTTATAVSPSPAPTVTSTPGSSTATASPPSSTPSDTGGSTGSTSGPRSSPRPMPPAPSPASSTTDSTGCSPGRIRSAGPAAWRTTRTAGWSPWSGRTAARPPPGTTARADRPTSPATTAPRSTGPTTTAATLPPPPTAPAAPPPSPTTSAETWPR